MSFKVPFTSRSIPQVSWSAKEVVSWSPVVIIVTFASVASCQP
jgi:hypothetical protein